MTSSVNGFGVLIQEQQKVQDAQKAEELKKQQEDKEWNDTVRKWTGVDNEQSGMTYVGQCLAAPVTMTANLGGGILGGVLGGVGNLLSPVFGFLGGIFGGGQQAQNRPQPQNGPQPQPGQPNNAGGSSGSTNAASAKTGTSAKSDTSAKSAGTTCTSSASDTSESSSAKTGSSSEKTSASKPTHTNAKLGSVTKRVDINTGKLSPTIDIEHNSEQVSSFTAGMLEEFNEADGDVNTLTKELQAKQQKRADLAAANKGKEADQKTTLTSKIEQFDKAIKNYETKGNAISADIQAQQKALESCTDENQKARIESTIKGLQEQFDDIKMAIEDAKAQREEANDKLKDCSEKAADAKSPEAQLAQLDAEISSLEHQITTAEIRRRDAKKQVQKADEEAWGDESLKKDALAAKAATAKFLDKADEDEANAEKVDFSSLKASAYKFLYKRKDNAPIAESKPEGDKGPEKKPEDE